MFLRRRLKVKHEGERRSLFLRYVGEVATAVTKINGGDRQALYDNLLHVARKRTLEADTQLDDRGKKIEEVDYGGSVLIVPRHDPAEASLEQTG
jgi:DNA topoisomerase-6 subunit B